MYKYVVRRLALMVPTLAIFTVLLFVLLRVLPGDVAQKMLIDDSGAQTASKASLDRLRESMGLNRPLYVQYLSWIGDTVRGDLGSSLFTGRPVIQDLKQRLPLTVQLALMALIISTCLGIPIGIMSAVKQNSPVDLGLRFFSIFFLAAPGFWVALLAILAGSQWFGWVPHLGYNLLWQKPMANLSQLGVPALILGLAAMATYARMTRSTMLEVLREDYIRTARSKGLREQVVVRRHAVKNAMIPVVTLIGLQFGNIMAGSIILETIFGIPGMGSYLITAVQRTDFTVVQSVVMVFALMFMFTNLVVDLLYGWLDPRISYA